MELLWARKHGLTDPDSPGTAALARLVQPRVKQIPAREDIVREGDVVERVAFVLAGWACCYKVLSDGRRQIVSLVLPGDLCGSPLHGRHLADVHVGALGPAMMSEVPLGELAAVAAAHPALHEAFSREFAIDAAIQRAWTISLGQRNARERLAHLVCEIAARLKAVGLVSEGSFLCPVTQAEIADMLGVSNVHINRTLQELREDGLIATRGRSIHLPDLARLRQAGGFDPAYLQDQCGVGADSACFVATP